MQPLAYLHLQMRLEGKELVKGDLMKQVEIVPDEELPLMLLARLGNEELVTYYDEVISPDLQKELSATLAKVVFPKIDRLLDVLKSHHIQAEVGNYKTYVFSSQPGMDADVLCLSKQDSRVKAFEFDGFAEQVYAIEQNGILVSACVSTRENETCGEAWVSTTPEYRKQGFAQKVVNTWAASLMSAGKVPFYNHDIKNDASANLAKKLGLLPVFEEIVIAQI
ncbi:MAG: GNAT family N-acetyltransferase [Chloroflexi bacterium]|nr:MAG: GNAT family N-acetyltransferase [Chloroflexota bacterium]